MITHCLYKRAGAYIPTLPLCTYRVTTVILGVHNIRQKESWQVFRVTNSIPYPAYKVENNILINDLRLLKVR